MVGLFVLFNSCFVPHDLYYQNMSIHTVQLIASKLTSATVFQDTVFLVSSFVLLIVWLILMQFQMPSGQLLRTLSGHSNVISNIFVEQERVIITIN
jgi:hypothetical protein